MYVTWSLGYRHHQKHLNRWCRGRLCHRFSFWLPSNYSRFAWAFNFFRLIFIGLPTHFCFRVATYWTSDSLDDLQLHQGKLSYVHCYIFGCVRFHNNVARHRFYGLFWIGNFASSRDIQILCYFKGLIPCLFSSAREGEIS
jgi:hypothetical protein